MNPTTAQRHAQIGSLYAQGLNDTDIAFRLGISARTVANYRRSQGWPSQAANIQTGLYGEHLVVAQGLVLDLPTTHLSPLHRDHPFDVLLNGWRVEVKTVHDSSGPGVFKFFLSPTRKGKRAEPGQVKDYRQDCDFVALVCKPRSGQPDQVFVMTPQEAGEYVRIDLNNVASHQPYLSAWHRLSVPRLQAA